MVSVQKMCDDFKKDLVIISEKKLDPADKLTQSVVLRLFGALFIAAATSEFVVSAIIASNPATTLLTILFYSVVGHDLGILGLNMSNLYRHKALAIPATFFESVGLGDPINKANLRGTFILSKLVG